RRIRSCARGDPGRAATRLYRVAMHPRQAGTTVVARDPEKARSVATYPGNENATAKLFSRACGLSALSAFGWCTRLLRPRQTTTGDCQSVDDDSATMVGGRRLIIVAPRKCSYSSCVSSCSSAREG